MDRGGFLKSLGALFVGGLIKTNVPDFIIPKTEVSELKFTPNPLFEDENVFPDRFVNHMTIQRKACRITGSATSKTVYFNFESEKAD